MTLTLNKCLKKETRGEERVDGVPQTNCGKSPERKSINDKIGEKKKYTFVHFLAAKIVVTERIIRSQSHSSHVRKGKTNVILGWF